MPANPYAPQLANRNPNDVIASTPARLEKLLHEMGAQRANQPWAPGKWSPRQIVCHLADCELAFGFRLRQALAEDHHVVQPFDQTAWSKTYAAYDAAAALATFAAVRRWNLAFLKALSPADLQKKMVHPERGEMTLETIVDTMGGHDLNHLAQVEAAAAKSQTA